jgi:RHS repeat-associated protein
LWPGSPPLEELGESANAGGYPYQFFYYSAFSRGDHEGKLAGRNVKLAPPSPASGVMRDGESLVQQHANTGHFATPYKFNAKELDMETGNYYYGARYYNPQTSIWFGVDPLAAKYPHVTPYNFVEGNPIMLIDPTGMGPEGPGEPEENEPKQHTIQKGDTYYGLANRTYGDDDNITVDNLKKWNPGVDPDDLRIGQKINISEPVNNEGEQRVEYPGFEEYFRLQGRDVGQEIRDDMGAWLVTTAVSVGVTEAVLAEGAVASTGAAVIVAHILIGAMISFFVTGCYSAHIHLEEYNSSLTPEQQEQRRKDFESIKQRWGSMTHSE